MKTLHELAARIGRYLNRVTVATLPPHGSARALGRAQALAVLVPMHEDAEAVVRAQSLLGAVRETGLSAKPLTTLTTQMSEEIDRWRASRRG